MNVQKRRKFLRGLGTLSGAVLLQPFAGRTYSRLVEMATGRLAGLSAEACATEEDFWYLVRQAYTVSPTIVNLNNGGVSPQPRVVQEAVERYNKYSNEAPSYYMWRVLDLGREPLRRQLAGLAGCDTEEIAINRNTSEALETVIFGLRLKAGDEVVLTKQDYPNIINAWKQRAHRDGIRLKWLSFDFPIEDKMEIAGRFVDAFTPQTKVVNLTHVINWNGQILPVREIAREARSRGIQVVVDGAHSFAHLPFQVDELECDYFGTSLHKWLCAPFGSGMLYVRRERIRELYPLFAGDDPERDDIRKFENLGTRSFAVEQAIGQAIQFHQTIGSQRKFERLHFLKNYWAERAAAIPGVRLHTSLSPGFAGALALVSVEGAEPGELHNYLFRNYKIHTTAINWENLHGVRITPNVYTSLRELDLLVEALVAFVKDIRK